MTYNVILPVHLIDQEAPPEHIARSVLTIDSMDLVVLTLGNKKPVLLKTDQLPKGYNLRKPTILEGGKVVALGDATFVVAKFTPVDNAD